MLSTLIKIRLQGIFLRSIKGSKKKNVGIGKLLLMIFLFLYLAVVFLGMFGFFFSSILEPFVAIGYEWLYFSLMSLTVIAFCFLVSIFITQQEIYGAKDNDLLLSMPIPARTILLSRIFVLLIMNYIYEAIIGLPCIVVYFYQRTFDVIQLLFFLIIMLTLPLFVLSLSCIFGWILAMIMRRMKHKTLFTLAFSLLALGAYFYVLNSFPTYLNLLITNGASIAEAIQKTVFPLYHLGIAISEKQITSLLLYLICAIVPFIVVIWLLSYNFTTITTSKTHRIHRKVKDSDTKYHSLQMALLKREWQHFSANPLVILNTSLGILFTVVFAVAFLIKGENLIFALGNVPEQVQSTIKQFQMPLLCLVVIALNSIDTISASSISLEGNRLWILKSLPIKTEDILKSKLLFHLLLCVPSAIFCSIIGSVVLSLSFFDSIIAIIAPVLFLFIEGTIGLLLNLWKPKFDWVNETVVVKQSLPVTILMFGFMGFVAVIAFLYVYCFAHWFSPVTYTYILTALFALLSPIVYYCLMTWGKKRFLSL